MSNSGKIFEDDFRSSVDKDRCLLIRLNDQPQSFAKTARFSLKPPCDFVLYDSQTKLFCPIELKTTKYKSMSYEDINDENPANAMIHKHQLEKLLEFSKYNGVKSGLILNFRTEENNLQRTYYISIEDFLDMCKKINKKSVNEIDLLGIGKAIKINGLKKRTRYVWDINELLNSLNE
jgi:penicillin-binding protein-related factor A (putative recombinase)